MFINFSNHPTSNWSKEQLEAALAYGEVVDCAFPAVNSAWDEAMMRREIDAYTEKMLEMKPDAVMCQGEFVLTFGVVRILMEHGIKCLSACTDRVSEENIRPDGSVEKVSVFKFIKFREYI